MSDTMPKATLDDVQETKRPLTEASMRALVHVAAGNVTHQYTAIGNIYRGPRDSASQTFRRLAQLRLIEDTEIRHAGFQTVFKQRLTATGAKLLNE